MAGRPVLPLLLLLLAASAFAQVPSPAPSVEVSASPSEVDVSVEAPAEISIAVENTSPATGTPLDQPRTVLLEVTGAPDGWTASVSPASLQLAAGENGTARLTIAVATGASDGDIALTVTAKLLPLGASAIPGVGPAVDPEATATASVQAHRDDPVTRDILETIGPWIYVLLLAFLAAVLLSVRFVVASRRVTVALRSDQSEVTVFPGGRAAAPLVVQNLTKEEDTVVFQVSAVGNGWAAFLPVPELLLGPEATEELSLTVIASKDLESGATQSVLVTATSAQTPGRPATLSFQATVGEPEPKAKKAK